MFIQLTLKPRGTDCDRPGWCEAQWVRMMYGPPAICYPLMPTVAIRVQLSVKHHVPNRIKPSFVIFDIRATLMLTAEFQSAQMSKITNDGITRSGTGCFWELYPCDNSGHQRANCSATCLSTVPCLWPIVAALALTVYKLLISSQCLQLSGCDKLSWLIVERVSCSEMHETELMQPGRLQTLLDRAEAYEQQLIREKDRLRQRGEQLSSILAHSQQLLWITALCTLHAARCSLMCVHVYVIKLYQLYASPIVHCLNLRHVLQSLAMNWSVKRNAGQSC